MRYFVTTYVEITQVDGQDRMLSIMEFEPDIVDPAEKPRYFCDVLFRFGNVPVSSRVEIKASDIDEAFKLAPEAIKKAETQAKFQLSSMPGQLPKFPKNMRGEN